VFILIFKKFCEIDSEIGNEMLVDAVYQDGATKIWCRSCGFYRASPYPVSITMMNFVIPTKQQLSPKPRRVRMPNLDMLLTTQYLTYHTVNIIRQCKSILCSWEFKTKIRSWMKFRALNRSLILKVQELRFRNFSGEPKNKFSQKYFTYTSIIIKQFWFYRNIILL
jgi:hypothetical protein